MGSGLRRATSTTLGKRLRAARDELGIPQDELGVRIGLDETISSARISRYETGAIEPPVATAAQLAKVLRVPLAYLYCEDDLLAQMLLLASRMNREQKRKCLEVMQVETSK